MSRNRPLLGPSGLARQAKFALRDTSLEAQWKRYNTCSILYSSFTDGEQDMRKQQQWKKQIAAIGFEEVPDVIDMDTQSS